MAGLAEFLKPLNEVIVKANKMTEGRRSDFFNHLKTAADSLSALAWIAFTGKDCGEGNFHTFLKHCKQMILFIVGSLFASHFKV